MLETKKNTTDEKREKIGDERNSKAISKQTTKPRKLVTKARLQSIDTTKKIHLANYACISKRFKNYYWFNVCEKRFVHDQNVSVCVSVRIFADANISNGTMDEQQIWSNEILFNNFI